MLVYIFMVTVAIMYFYIILYDLIMWVNFEFGWLKCGPCYVIQHWRKCSYPTNKAEHNLQYHFGRCQDDIQEHLFIWPFLLHLRFSNQSNLNVKLCLLNEWQELRHHLCSKHKKLCCSTYEVLDYSAKLRWH